jgi:hypothetical protein
MTRRKGELTPAGIGRSWPHQIAFLAELSLGKLGAEQDAFCHAKRLLRCERFHFVSFEDMSYIVHCFATRAGAETFMENMVEIGSTRATGGKGTNWDKWYKGSGGKRS